MSVIRFVLDDYPTRSLFDQNFGVGLLNEDLLLQPLLGRAGYCRPWRHLTRKQSGTSSLSHSKETGFRVSLDVQQFKPEEINVKTVENSVVVEGRHEEREDEHGSISRHFVRRYALPEGVDLEQVQCQLSSDGVLTITVPNKPVSESETKVIPIKQTHAPAAVSSEPDKPAEQTSAPETQ